MTGTIKKLLIAAVALAVLAVGGTWVYINLIKEDAPAELSIDKPAGDGKDTGGNVDSAAAPDPEGTWTPTDASTVGYRIKEVLMGQNTEAVGRTNSVTGSLKIVGTQVTEAEFEVDMATIASDEGRRDAQFKGRIMDVATFPTATFTLTKPIDLGTIPEVGELLTTTATGDLTLRGVTRSVEVKLSAKREGATLKVDGEIPVVFSAWEIPNPSIGPVTTEDNGLLEFLLVYKKG